MSITQRASGTEIRHGSRFTRESAPRFGRGAARRAGFSMLEVSLALTVLVVALVATSASNARLSALQRSNRDRNVAHNAVQTISETIQAISRDGITDTSGWSHHLTTALSNGGQLGNTFDVSGLAPVDGDAHVGTIQVLTDETLTDSGLGLELGLPRDLNGDGDALDANTGTGARLLPVVVTLRWRSQAGIQRIVHPFYVFGY